MLWHISSRFGGALFLEHGNKKPGGFLLTSYIKPQAPPLLDASTAPMLEVWGLNERHGKEATSSDTSEGRPSPVSLHLWRGY